MNRLLLIIFSCVPGSVSYVLDGDRLCSGDRLVARAKSFDVGESGERTLGLDVFPPPHIYKTREALRLVKVKATFSCPTSCSFHSSQLRPPPFFILYFSKRAAAASTGSRSASYPFLIFFFEDNSYYVDSHQDQVCPS